MTASPHIRRPSPDLWRTVRRAFAALGPTRAEQIQMQEAWWQANWAATPGTGPLTWVLIPDGPRLADHHLPARGLPAPGARHDQHTTEKPGPQEHARP